MMVTFLLRKIFLGNLNKAISLVETVSNELGYSDLLSAKAHNCSTKQVVWKYSQKFYKKIRHEFLLYVSLLKQNSYKNVFLEICGNLCGTASANWSHLTIKMCSFQYYFTIRPSRKSPDFLELFSKIQTSKFFGSNKGFMLKILN